MKVWIVFHSYYEQSFPDAVFSSKDSAQAYADSQNAQGWSGWHEVLDPYELDNPEIEESP
jgi:hypothetical protein